MKPFSILTLLLAAMFTAPAALAAVIYVVDGDAELGWVVDTDALTFSEFSTAEVDIGYAIAVGDTIRLGGRDDGGAVEYDLAGNPTGNSWSGGGNFSELLDGTTDGVNNYAIEFGQDTNSVTVADSTWENQAVLFNLPDSLDGYGITYDVASGTLWVVTSNDSVMYNFAMNGDLLDTWPHDAEDGCCLAYDAADDTLWLGVNDSNVMRQYAKDGTLLDTVTIPGWSPENQYGAEIAIGAALAGPSLPVPSQNLLGLVLMASILMLAGFFALRSKA